MDTEEHSYYDQEYQPNHADCFGGFGELWFDSGEVCTHPEWH